MTRLELLLEAFAANAKIDVRSHLSVILFITRKASECKTPFSTDDFLSPLGCQVAELGTGAVQAILADHGISRVLAEEGGRISRGSIQRMRAYIELLNALAQEKILDFSAIEAWWIDRVKKHFGSKPLKIKVDASKSLRSIMADLIEAAFSRQRELPGTMIAGAVMQHMVGAKLELALPNVLVEHHGFSAADASGRRKGDFLVGDTAIHVTTAPTEALIRKCCDNLAVGLRPLVITTQSGVGGACALAKNADVADRVDILDVEQFVATNVYKWSAFQKTKRSLIFRQLIEIYNRIVDEYETDPSLRIMVG